MLINVCKDAYTSMLMEKPERRRPLGRPRRRWLDNIRVDLGELVMWWCGLDWSGSGWGQMESSCEFGIEPSGSIKCWETIKCPNNQGSLE
jgi:hypothetical protein